MKKIPLSKGKFAIVDDDDYPYLSRFRWCIGSTGHVMRNITLGSNKNFVFMASLIKSRKRGRFLFKNRNPLDLRKSNLIVTSYSTMGVYSLKTKSKTTSKYKGVYFDKKSGYWIAYVTKRDKNGKRIRYLYDSFDTENEAAMARNKKVLEVFGKLTYQNKIV